MTTHARIIVIGGGIVGVSILYHLAKAGEAEALLLERRELTAGATWHSAGNVHTMSPYANVSALQAYSLRLYDGLSAEVGQDVGSHVVGGIFLAQTPERMVEFKHLAGKFRALGLDYEIIGPAEITRRHPLVNVDDIVGGAWDPEEGYVDPYSVTMGLAAAARKHGGQILRNTQVDGISRLPSGGWRLTAGEATFECEIVVNCAGFWADDVGRMAGVRLPVVNMEHQYLVTETMPEVERLAGELPMIRDTDSQFYMRQEAQGLLIGPWEKRCREAWGGRGAPWSFGQELFPSDLDRMEDELAAIFHRVPALESAGIKRVVNGAISFSPDGRPMMGPVPGVDGFFVCCGNLSGITQGGGLGLAMSQWILEGEPEMDLHYFDVARFGDWTTKAFARARVHEILPLRYDLLYPGLERQQGRGLRTTPIHDALLRHGAVMGQASGWERPLWYAPEGVEPRDEPSFERPNWWEHVGAEARAMAASCGLVEMSSFGKFRVSGPDARRFLDQIGSAKLRAAEGGIALSLFLNARGGIVGDATILTETTGPEESFYLVGATLGAGHYRRWMEHRADGFEVMIEDVTERSAILGLAGPRSRELLNALSSGPEEAPFDSFPFMTAREVELGPVRARALRVSYSGELGWELHCPMTSQRALFDALMAEGEAVGLRLVGSRAMGMLRLEKGYRSWGAEMTTEITPAVAGLERFCSRGKDYLGRAAVDAERATPPARRMVTLEIDPGAPPCWGTEPVLRDDRLIGYVTSGGMGWRTDKMLAVAWIESASAAPGQALRVQILETDHAAVVARDPVYDANNSRLLA